jgi:hypothetical protein
MGLRIAARDLKETPHLTSIFLAQIRRGVGRKIIVTIFSRYSALVISKTPSATPLPSKKTV